MQKYLFRIILIDMKLLKLSLLIIIFASCLPKVDAQFYKRFSADIGINKSKIINTGFFYPAQNEILDNLGRIDKKNETPAITTNYSMSLGYRIYKNHHLKIRHSRNRIGTYITGNFGFYGFCDVGESPIVLKQALNQYKNATLGIKYEFQLPFYGGALTFGAGYEKQWNSIEDTFIVFPGVFPVHHALHTTAGLMTPLFSIVHLYSNIFVTKSIGNNTPENILTYRYMNEINFVPIQIGMEVGIRLSFHQS